MKGDKLKGDYTGVGPKQSTPQKMRPPNNIQEGNRSLLHSEHPEYWKTSGRTSANKWRQFNYQAFTPLNVLGHKYRRQAGDKCEIMPAEDCSEHPDVLGAKRETSARQVTERQV